MTRSETLKHLANQLDDKVNELADRMLGGQVVAMPSPGAEQATRWMPRIDGSQSSVGRRLVRPMLGMRKRHSVSKTSHQTVRRSMYEVSGRA